MRTRPAEGASVATALRQFEKLSITIREPVLARARRSAAFQALLRDFGYVDYWRATGAWSDFCRPTVSDQFECY